MKSVKLYFPETEEFILAVEGTGDNLLDGDIAQGYKDYIMATIYRAEGSEFVELDGGQIMSKKLISDMTDDEFVAKVLRYWYRDLDDLSDYEVLK